MADESRVTIRMRLVGAAMMARDSKRAAGGLRRVGREGSRANRIHSALGRSTGKVTSGMRAAAGAAIGLGAAYLGITGARTAIDNTEELAKATIGLHKSFGLSIPQASRWAAVLKARGVDARGTNMAFSSLAKNMVAARRGTKSAQAQFRTLGITTKDLSKDHLDFNAILFRVADALHHNQRDYRAAQAARAIFGRGFQTMVPLLRGGSAALEENLKQADKYGVTLNRKTIGPVMELVQSQRELKVAGLGLQVQLSRLLIPSLLKLEHAGERVLTVFNRKDLTLGQKVTKSGQIVSPLIRSISRSGPEIQDAITTVVAAAAPALAKSAGMLGVAVVKGLWHSITDPKSGLFTKAILLAFIAKKLGLFGLLGSLAGQAFRRRFGTPMPAPTGGPGGGLPRGGGKGGIPPGLTVVGPGGGGLLGLAGGVAASALPFLALSGLGLGIAAAGGGHFGGEFRSSAEARRFTKSTQGGRNIPGGPRAGLFLGAAQRDAKNVSRRQQLFARALTGVTSTTRGTATQFARAALRAAGVTKSLGDVGGEGRKLSPAMRRLTRKIGDTISGLDVTPDLPKPRGGKRATPKASGKKSKPSPQATRGGFMVVHVHNTVDAKGLHTAVYHHERLIAEAR